MNSQTKFIKTNEKIEVPNYPYGFRLKTTLTDYIEFVSNKGYRHCTSTIDPRNGRANNPKKSTYYPLLVRYYNEEGHIKSVAFHFNGDEEINEGCKLLAENFEIFTPEEIKRLYALIQYMGKVDFKATCVYGGSKPEELAPLYAEFYKLCKHGYDTGENVFSSLVLDTEAINRTKPENFSPFKITTYETN